MRYYGRRGKERKVTEAWKPDPNPPHRRMRPIIRFFAHAQVVTFNRLQVSLGEEPKSAALGVESVRTEGRGREAERRMKIKFNMRVREFCRVEV